MIASKSSPDSGLPVLSLARLEPSTGISAGQALPAWVRIDRDPENTVRGGVIFADSATGNQWHAFVFRPGDPRETRAVFYKADPVAGITDTRTVTVWVNDVFEDYRAGTERIPLTSQISSASARGRWRGGAVLTCGTVGDE